VFFELLPKLSDSKNYNDFIGKITSNSITLNPVFVQCKILSQKNFSSDKMKNSGNYIYDYAYSFFGEDFLSNALYWYAYVLIYLGNFFCHNSS